jgi:zinc protease
MGILRALFESIPRSHLLAAPPEASTAVTEPSTMVLAGAGNESWVMVGFLMPGIRDADYPAAAVLNAIIGADSGILTSLFRERSGVYDSGTFLQPFASEAHIVGYVRADPLLWDQKQQKMRPLVADFQRQMLSIFTALHDHGATAAQLEFGKQYAVGQYLRAREHNRDEAGYLGWYEAIGLGAAFDFRFVQEIRGVTLEQINHVARDYFQAPASVVIFPMPVVEASGE